MSFREKWDKVTNSGDSFKEFDDVELKRSSRPDLHAFIMLDELFPKSRDIVTSASHDQIWLDVSEEEIETLTEEQILELSRSGVFYDDECCALSMFV